jgi:hypothetical protein
MRVTFAHLSAFVTAWNRLRLNDDDLQALEAQLLQNPDCGQVMKETGGLRKTRFAPPSMHIGKSGALRVCYVYFRIDETIYLFYVFAKNEQANLTRAERHVVRAAIQRLSKQ